VLFALCVDLRLCQSRESQEVARSSVLSIV